MARMVLVQRSLPPNHELRLPINGEAHTQSVWASPFTTPSLSLQHLIVLHPRRREVGPAAIGEGGLRAGKLVGVVVLPLDRNRAVEANTVKLDENLLQRV